MAETHGTTDPAFEAVHKLFHQRITSGEELGASLCVNIDGKNVVDLWGGYADVAQSQPWQKDTVTTVWSCSKIVTNLAALILIDRGLLDPNENVATYWPEFAANGKENVKVWHVLSHAAGLPGWETPISTEDVFNVKEATERLAAQAPWWTPGEGSGYHLVTQGHLVGEIIRRVTGKPVEDFVAAEITGPLGADFYYGLPEDQWPRAAELVPPPLPPFDQIPPGSILMRAIMGSPLQAELSMTPGFRNTVLAASNGFGNARALARIGSIVSLNGAVDGTQVVKPSSIDQFLEERTSGTDRVNGEFTRFCLGVAISDLRTRPWIPESDETCYWGGWGGSIIVMDRKRRMTIGYVMNKMTSTGTIGNPSTRAYVEEIYKIVEGLGS